MVLVAGLDKEDTVVQIFDGDIVNDIGNGGSAGANSGHGGNGGIPGGGGGGGQPTSGQGNGGRGEVRIWAW